MRSLLMGGQACVLYGAAEFSRDTDLAILADDENLARLRSALRELRAERIAVPPFERKYLDMGLAVHFRCERPDVERMRVDVMARLRGVEPFPELWKRRTTVEVENEPIEVLALPDLVAAKKTQRDKDWPMVARLVEASYFTARAARSREQTEFWLRELRTPSLLIELAACVPQETARLEAARPLLGLARAGDEDGLRNALREEEERERAADRAYWEPLKRELARLREDARG